MPNPRYYQNEPSKKEQKLQQYSQFQEGQQRQQALDQRSQAGMMEQLQQMYGLSQAQQMDPLKMEALRAQTTAQQFQNDWAQANAMQGYDMNAAKLAQMPETLRAMQLQNTAQDFQNQWAQPNAQQAYAGNQAKIDQMPEVTRGMRLQNDAQNFQNQWAQPNAMNADALVRAQIEALGREKQKTLPQGFEYLPPDAQTAALDEMYPQLKVQRAQKAQQENDANWNALVNEAQQGSLTPDRYPNVVNQFGEANLAHLLTLLQPKPAPPQTNAAMVGRQLQTTAKGMGDMYGQAFYGPIIDTTKWLNAPAKNQPKR